MKARVALLTASTLLLALILAYLLMDLVNEYVLKPVLHVLHFFELIYDAFPQSLWWGVLLLVLFVIAGRSLAQNIRPPARHADIIDEGRLSRAMTWRNWIERSRGSNYSKWLLARHLARLTLDILAHQERGSPERLQGDVQAGEINLPPQVQAYLQVGLEAPSFRHYADLLTRLGSSRRTSPLDLDPEVIVEFLESKIQSGGSL